MPGHGAYGSTKGAVRLYSKHAAVEFGVLGYGIRVNSVHPGFILTPIVVNALAGMPAGQAEAFQARIIDSIPVRAMGEALDIANGVLFLASDESRYMTGSELVIDGGYTAR